MADKDKKARAIDNPSSAGIHGGVAFSIAATAPPAPGSIPAPFGLQGSSSILFSAVSPSVGVSLTWYPGENTNPQSYTLQYSLDSSFPEDGTSTEITIVNSALIDGLNPNTTYYFRVAANYRAIMSPWSDSIAVLTVSDTTPPDPIAQSSMAWSWPIGDLYISWDNPTNSNFRDVRVEIWSDSSKTIKYVDDYSSTGQYIFSAGHNFQVTSGSPDPSVYVELSSRSWSNVHSTATTFGPASNPTTQPFKAAPITPTGLAADFTGPDCIFTWNDTSDSQDYVLTIDGLEHVILENRYTYTFSLNKIEHSGTPDPSLTYFLQARDGLLQRSAATSTATATNAPPSAVSTVASTWDGDIGLASADLLLAWPGYIQPADLLRYELYIWEDSYVGTVKSIITVDKFGRLTYAENQAHWGGDGENRLNYELYVIDMFNQASTAKTGVVENVEPPIPTVLVFAGFTTIYAQITPPGVIQDFNHYHYRLRLGGTNGVADGTIIREWDDVVDNPLLSIDEVGNYKLGVQTYDHFQQTHAETVSDLVFIDALTIEELRAEGTYTDSIGTDFTVAPNSFILKDNAVGAGITYTPSTTTFGKTAIGGSNTDLPADTKKVQRYAPSVSGALTKLSVYVSGNGIGTGSQVMKGIIYTDAGSNPLTLLGQTAEVTVTDGQAAGWVDLTFDTPINVISGTNYWIGLIGGANTNTIRWFRDTGSSGVCKTATDTYSDGASASFGTPTNANTEHSIYGTVSDYVWIQFERPLAKIYRRITFKVGSGNPLIYLAFSEDGTNWDYFSGVDVNGYETVERASQALAASNAVNASSYIYQFIELPLEVQSRFVRVYISGNTRVDEYYPRTMIMSDDIAAEAIRALNIAAGAVVADKIAAGAVTAVKLSVGIGGGNLIANGGLNRGLDVSWTNYFTGATPVNAISALSVGGGGAGYNYVQQSSAAFAAGDRLGLFQQVASGVRGGSYYTISSYVWSSTPTYVLYIDWLNSSNTIIGTSFETFIAGEDYSNVGGDPFSRVTHTSLAPATSAKANIYFFGTASVALENLYHCGFQFEEGDVATSWKAGYRGNVQIDGEGILVGIYNGARTTLTQGGLIGYNSSNVEQVRIDSSTGFLRSGVAGAQRVEISSSGLIAYNSSNAEQVRISSSDGKLTASSGDVTVDSSGLSLKYQGSATTYVYQAGPSLKIFATGLSTSLPVLTLDAGYHNVAGGDIDGALIFGGQRGSFHTTRDVSATINAQTNSTNGAQLVIQADNNVSGTTPSMLLLASTSSNSHELRLEADKISMNTSVLQVTSAGVSVSLALPAAHKFHIQGATAAAGSYGLVVRTSTNVNNFYIEDNGAGFLRATAWTHGPSSREFKKNIVDLPEGLNKLRRVKPRRFDYINGRENNYGFIAEELEKELPFLVTRDKVQGDVGIRTTDFIPIIINALQELDKRLDLLESKR